MRMWWNGRHDSFRSYWPKGRGGSSPLIRTIIFFTFIILFLSFQTAGAASFVTATFDKSSKTITLSIAKVTNARYYHINRSGVSPAQADIFSDAATTVSGRVIYKDTGIAEGSYTYTVTAYGMSGFNTELQSGSVTIVASTGATTTTVRTTISGSNINVTFGNIGGANYYILQRQATGSTSSTGNQQFNGVTSPYTDTNVPSGTWKYGLTAKNGDTIVAGNMWSAEVTVGSGGSGGGTGGGSGTGTGTKTTASHTTLLGVQDNDLRAWINKLVNWIAYRIGPGVVLLMIIYAGIEYIGSQGDPTKIKAAKDRIEGSLLGLVVLLLIGVIMRMILPPTA